MIEGINRSPRRGHASLTILLGLPIAVTFSLWNSSAFAMGGNFHFLTGHEAKKLTKGALKNLIGRKESDAYKLGLLFPDIVNPITKHENRVYLHHYDFLNDYAEAIHKNCILKKSKIFNCDKAKAHFLGAMGHIIMDPNYDRNFVKAVGNNCVDTLAESKAAIYWSGHGRKDAFADQRLDRAAFMAIPRRAFRIAGRIDVKKIKNPAKKAKAIKANVISQRKAKQARYNLWKATRPNAKNYPALFVADFLIKTKPHDGNDPGRGTKYSGQTRARVVAGLTTGLTTQWKINIDGESVGSRTLGKGPPAVRRGRVWHYTPQAIKNFTQARKECPWGANFDNWFKNAKGGIIHTAKIQARFMEKVWDIWGKKKEANF